ncbi:beta-phosphoglucomutase family hydrolase [Gilvimarinus sp. F26214L]|uniref:beta-phosphoglucomutase family hydrolase n=1 Tax=Gilvimarinus sp. DZF01 TaxID=3461371 RepID=UPI00404682B5
MGDSAEPTSAIWSYDAVIFDMDGVITRTADLHAMAWKSLFDQFLQQHPELPAEARRPFDIEHDYFGYVDGKPRHAGARAFLHARGIETPEGEPADPETVETVYGLGKRKDALFEKQLHSRGVQVFEGALQLIRALREAGIQTAVATSSRHGRQVLASAGLTSLFDAVLDGIDIHELGLTGKPSPDAFLACARRLGVNPARAIIVEDAIVGVQAGQGGGFALTVGVDHGGKAEALARHGADVVVSDLAELDPAELASRVEERRQQEAWFIEQIGFDPSREPDLESMYTVANGYMGVRGAPDIPLPNSQGDLFVAGIYASKHPSRPYSEAEFMTEERESKYAELVSLPFPFRLSVDVDGEELTQADNRWRRNRRLLDMHNAVVRHETTFNTGDGRETSIGSQRFASLANRHVLAHEFILCADNHSSNIHLNTSLLTPHLADRHPHLRASPVQIRQGMEIQCYRTTGSDLCVCVASRTLHQGDSEEGTDWRLAGRIGEPLAFRRFVVIYTSRDCDNPLDAALETLKTFSWDSFDQLMAAYRRAWQKIWQSADIEIVGAPAVVQALRFHVYHLTGAAANDGKVSVGARALTGRAYEGHVFWDVEIFMLPFYLHSQPLLARSLLSYRYHTLDGARLRARELGHVGACYAWESTASGEDVTPRKIILRTTRKEIPIYTGTQQLHVTADVAYGLWRYWEATGDEAFMAETGVEVFAETARFWHSRCVEENNRYHLRGVVGPDEYHHSVDDNAYTNWMAWFNLVNACRAVNWLWRKHPSRHAELVNRIALAESELQAWRHLLDRLHRPQPNKNGIIEQFEGFFELADYPLPAEERFKAPISRLFDWEEINRLKLIKQADVLMLLHLFPECFPPDVLAANYDFYEPITDHGSSLSPSIHAAIAARLGRQEAAEHYWRQSLFLDLSNVMHNSSLGVHPAAMGGTWQALLWGFLGVSFAKSSPTEHRELNDELEKLPDRPFESPLWNAEQPIVGDSAARRLPQRWRHLAFTIYWRGRSHRVEVSR